MMVYSLPWLPGYRCARRHGLVVLKDCIRMAMMMCTVITTNPNRLAFNSATIPKIPDLEMPIGLHKITCTWR
jgi:hypothetical protein